MTSRHSKTTATAVEYALWLVLNENGDVKMSRRDPSLAPRERAVRLRVVVPRAIFNTPSIKATVEIPDTGQNRDGELDAKVAFVTETLKGVFGGEINITVGGGE